MKYTRLGLRPPATSETNPTPVNSALSSSGSTNQTSAEINLSDEEDGIVDSHNKAQIDFFTNHHISRSFNSLILDDISNDISQKKRPINKSPSFNVKHDYYYMKSEGKDVKKNTKIDENHDDNDNYEEAVGTKEDIYEQDNQHENNPLTSIGPTKLFNYNNQSQEIEKSSQTSIKRSSKFLNLSLDSNLSKSPQGKVQHSPEKTTPFFNKFKRPHQLVSQSPSPSTRQKSVTNSINMSFDYRGSPKVSSPVELSTKGFKLPKFSRKEVIASPDGSIRDSGSLTTNIFNSVDTGREERLSAKKVRKTSLHKSPFKQGTSPPSVPKYLDGIYMDSPSRNRKSSNSSSGSVIIYQDSHAPGDIRNAGTGSRLLNLDYDDKENKSYEFVKPLQAAFKSTGLLKKDSIKETRKLPPETPIKRNPLIPINTNKPSLTSILHLGHDEVEEGETTFDQSVEYGRDGNVYSSNRNNSSSSVFKISGDGRDPDQTLLNPAMDIDLGSDLDIAIPETPTRAVLKSHSMPANFSPVNFARRGKRINDTFANEPSTPRNSLFKKEESISVKPSNIDEHLVEKFGMENLRYIGSGEFSIAYECLFHNQKFAIKRSKKPVLGRLERKSIMREISALRILTSVKDNEALDLQEQEEGKEHLVYFIEAWDFSNYYYIMTEFCDNGSLYEFLEENKSYKIDEFRIWKILIEILNGIKFIHLKNFLHLDLKPANIFITFEGSLKIGDFGLATRLPILEKDFDLEGDRNYIAPELINDKIYTPFADIFSVGLIVLESAANIVLPDNGTPWRKLRSGDLSDAGKLSSDNLSDFLQHHNFSSVSSYNSESCSSKSLSHLNPSSIRNKNRGRNIMHELAPVDAPEFLVNGDSLKLDKLVNKMLKPNPFDRPTAKMILEMDECLTIDKKRKAGAIIFEGEFGPQDEFE